MRGPRSCWRDALERRRPASRGGRGQPWSPRGSTRRALAAGRHLLDQRGRVDHQRDALIAELARAGEAAHALERAAERLDDHVLLADQRAHDEPEPARADRGDDDVLARAAARVRRVACRPRASRRAEPQPPRRRRPAPSSAEEPGERQSWSVLPRSVTTSRPSMTRTAPGSSTTASCTLASGIAKSRSAMRTTSALMMASVIGERDRDLGADARPRSAGR